MLEFVILFHQLPPDSTRSDHWDLMLRVADKLRTWALAENPLVTAQTTGEELEDHRIDYLNYEGPVSGGRGTVSRVASGRYQLLTGELNLDDWSAVLEFDSGDQLNVELSASQFFRFEHSVVGPAGQGGPQN